MGLAVDNGQSGEDVNAQFYYSDSIYIYSTYFIFIIDCILFLGTGILACLSIEPLIFHCASNTPPQAKYSLRFVMCCSCLGLGSPYVNISAIILFVGQY